MSYELAISVDPNGTVEFTRNEILEEMFDGCGEMQRVTEIFKTAPHTYHIKWLMGPYAGQVHTFGMSAAYGRDLCTPAGALDKVEVPFSSYDYAVAHEVGILSAMRKAGVRFTGQ